MKVFDYLSKAFGNLFQRNEDSVELYINGKPTGYRSTGAWEIDCDGTHRIKFSNGRRSHRMIETDCLRFSGRRAYVV